MRGEGAVESAKFWSTWFMNSPCFIGTIVLSMRKLAKQEGVSVNVIQNTLKRFGIHNTLLNQHGRDCIHKIWTQNIDEQFERKNKLEIIDYA